MRATTYWKSTQLYFSLQAGKNKLGPSGGAPSSWQHYELVHSFLGAYRIHNMEQNTLENESMSPHLYFRFKIILKNLFIADTREYFVELLDVGPDDREASTRSGSQRSGSTAPLLSAQRWTISRSL